MAHPATQAPPGGAGSSKLPAWAKLGAIFGVVSALSILTWGPIGVSGTYPRFIGAIFRRLTPDLAHANPYLEKMGSLIKPETFLVIGLLIGGFLAAKLAGDHAAPAEYPHPGETTKGKRYRDAFIGGFLIVFGARIAGGCTSGHIISGITQLSVSGMIFAAGVFAAGILTAKLMHRGAQS
ncbi:MAG TPA: YeeE/YedE thiosulfate transporter family protein [Gemmatimonadaceae bacterium]|jgi:hypothetical protein